MSQEARNLPPGLAPGQASTALAPMQDVTDLAFMRVIAGFGGPDFYFTEFFRVHAQSRLEKHILRSITENDTGRPVFAQLIGEHIPDMLRTVQALAQYPVAGIDLNLGCPAPKVYKKNVGGGLLRDPAKVDLLLGAMREAVGGLFTVKMRIGFEDDRHFDELLALMNRHQVDLLSVHGRTVKEGYRSQVHYDRIAHAVRQVRCPVLANGDVTSAARAREVLSLTGAAGVMVGRHAIRNPWIFQQIRDLLAGRPAKQTRLSEVRDYVEKLYHATRAPGVPEHAHVAKMKKYLNFVGQGVDPRGDFLRDMRRAESEKDLFAACDRHLHDRDDSHFAAEPHPGVIARPNCESPAAECSLESVTA